jgi:hypothetical protein
MINPAYTFFNKNSDKIFDEKLYNDQILKTRNDLDKRLNTIYKNKNIIKETQQKQINANVYANIMLTVLGTCILYFSFVKFSK